ILGAIVGMLSWLIWSAINYYVGKLLKGKGTIQEMNTAMAISFIPLAVSGIFCLLDVIFLRDALFVEAYLSPFQIGWLLVSAFFVFILSVWSLFLMIKAVAEVHRFSSWKGLLDRKSTRLNSSHVKISYAVFCLKKKKKKKHTTRK